MNQTGIKNPLESNHQIDSGLILDRCLQDLKVETKASICFSSYILLSSNTNKIITTDWCRHNTNFALNSRMEKSPNDTRFKSKSTICVRDLWNCSDESCVIYRLELEKN